MGDRLRVRRRPRTFQAVTAAARILQATRNDEPQPEHWHDQAWGYRNITGELRYAEMWLGNSMGRARLIAARRERPGAEPEPLDEAHPASELVARLAGGVGGQAALLRQFATYLLTPGIGYLVGADPRDGGGWSWQVRSADEIRLSPTVRTDDGRPTYEIRTGDEVTDWHNLGPNGLVVKVYRPDPRESWKPDSPVRGAMPILEELRLLTESINATAISRLAGAGLLLLPSEIQFEQGWEAWVKELVKVLTTPIKDRSAAAATVPYPVKVPGAMLDKVKHLMFNTPFDEHALKLREELIQRLGTAMDMPVRTLTGEQENHWGKAATAEEGVKLHTQPNLELVCDGLTIGYLRPGLAVNGLLEQDTDLPSAGRLLAEATEGTPVVDDDDAEIIVWYDLSDFNARPDRGEDAMHAYDRWEVPGEVLRAELGLSEAEPPDDDELARRVWLTIIDKGGDADMVRLALRKLNLADEDELPAAPAPPMPPTDPSPEEEPGPRALPAPVPQTEPTDRPPSEDDRQSVPRAADAAVVAVVAACDGLVHRALEKAGNRLRSRTVQQRKADPGLDERPHLMHTACVATSYCSMDALMDGAWDRVTEVATNLGLDSEQLCVTLDAYTRELIRTRTPHSWQLLGHHLADRANGHGPAYRAAVMTHADTVRQLVTRR